MQACAPFFRARRSHSLPRLGPPHIRTSTVHRAERVCGATWRGRAHGATVADQFGNRKDLTSQAETVPRLQEGWTPVQAACWDDCMKALGELLKHRPNLDAKDDVRSNPLEHHPGGCFAVHRSDLVCAAARFLGSRKRACAAIYGRWPRACSEFQPPHACRRAARPLSSQPSRAATAASGAFCTLALTRMPSIRCAHPAHNFQVDAPVNHPDRASDSLRNSSHDLDAQYPASLSTRCERRKLRIARISALVRAADALLMQRPT